jgi:hypothetical protein
MSSRLLRLFVRTAALPVLVTLARSMAPKFD